MALHLRRLVVPFTEIRKTGRKAKQALERKVKGFDLADLSWTCPLDI